MPTSHVFRLQLIATPGDKEGDLDCVLLMEVPKDKFDPLDYLAFLKAGHDKTSALFEEELDKIATTYAGLKDIEVEAARIELLGIVCEQGGLTLDAGGGESEKIILAD